MSKFTRLTKLKTMKNKTFKQLFAPVLCLFLALASCSSDDGDSAPDDNILTLTTTSTTVFLDDDVHFVVKANQEALSDVTIYVNEQPVKGMLHSFTRVGTYTISAKKEGFVDSNTLEVTVIEQEDELTKNARKFKHKTLVEDITGAWCQYCPYVAFDIDTFEKSDPDKFQAIAIHGTYDINNNDPNYGGHDPYDFNPSARMKFSSELGLDGYPFARTDRKIDFRKNPNSVVDRQKEYSPIGVKIYSKLESTSGKIDIAIKFGEDFIDNFNYAVFVLEDGLVFRQSNSTQYYRDAPFIWSSGWTQNFIHNNTLRGMTDGGFRGSPIPKDFTIQDKEFVVNDITINYKSENIDKLKVVVVVTNAKTGEVLNTVVARGNKRQNYQIVL